MFDHTSRYFALETALHPAADGRLLPYKRRRFCPSGESLPLAALEPVAQGDRIDLISARTLGVSEMFWRIADANDAMDPAGLVEPGRRLRIPQPQP